MSVYSWRPFGVQVIVWILGGGLQRPRGSSGELSIPFQSIFGFSFCVGPCQGTCNPHNRQPRYNLVSKPLNPHRWPYEAIAIKRKIPRGLNPKPRNPTCLQDHRAARHGSHGDEPRTGALDSAIRCRHCAAIEQLEGCSACALRSIESPNFSL